MHRDLRSNILRSAIRVPTIAPEEVLAIGPILLFDKSFVEMLNVDEAALFDFLYLTNICPMFLTEVVAQPVRFPSIVILFISRLAVST